MATSKKPASVDLILPPELYQRIRKLERLLHTKQCHPDYMGYIRHNPKKTRGKPAVSSQHICLGQWTINGERTFLYAVPAEHLRQPINLRAGTPKDVMAERNRAEQLLARLTIHAHAVRAMPGYQYSHLTFDQSDELIANCAPDPGTWQLNLARQEGGSRHQATVFQFDPSGLFVALMRLTPKGQQDGYVEADAFPVHQPKQPKRQRVKYLPQTVVSICLPQWIIERHEDAPPYTRMLSVIEDRGYPLIALHGVQGRFTRPNESTMPGFAKGDWNFKDGILQVILRG